MRLHPPILRNQRTRKRRRRAGRNKLQPPTPNLQSNTKLQKQSWAKPVLKLEFNLWSFSGGWMLVVGCFSVVPADGGQTESVFPALSAGTHRSSARLSPGFHVPDRLLG